MRNHHHHHHIVLAARISLTLSRHSSLSFIALGRSSGQQPVSSHSCWMYVRAGRPAFARPCVGIHKSTAGVLQGDTLAPYLFIICLDYVLRTSIDKIKENGFELTKKRSRRYPATTITDADYADDIAILANTPVQAETLLHSLERAAASIGLLNAK